MCGRFLIVPDDELAEILEVARQNLEALGHPGMQLTTGEVFPTNLAPVLVSGARRLEARAMYWGFPMARTRENRQRALQGKKPLQPKTVFNTRAETAETSPFWRDSFLQRRCILPTSGFFEWQHISPTQKQEFRFTLPQAEITYIAGIYQTMPGRSGPAWEHFSLLTTTPCQSIADVHDRMPVVLQPGEHEQWLHGDYRALLNRDCILLDRMPA